MTFKVNITKRERKRRLTSGAVVRHTRYVVNYIDPKTRQRRQEFFEKQKDAQARGNALMAKLETGTYVDERKAPTVAQAHDHWRANKAANIKASTLAGYDNVTQHIVGPYLVGDAEQRAEFKGTGKTPKGTRVLPMLGDVKLTDLTTADIRSWHLLLSEHSGTYTANRAKSHLKSILALAEEDFGVRTPAMPTGLGRKRQKPKKAMLNADQVRALIEEARKDPLHGIYYAFPFLAGTRPSEQLGLLWSEVDFEMNAITIKRIQERDGALTEMTKTEAGTRSIPMGAILRAMLLDWKVRCPRHAGKLHRVFPGLGRLQPWPLPRLGGGEPLLYQNYRARMWKPPFKRLGLPYVTPHSARHLYISTMQAQGIEVGLVAKLAGHSNASVTLSHYTQAVRGGEVAVAALEKAFLSR